MPQKVLFISLMEGFPWGGSEELWSRTANVLLDKGVAVQINVKYWPQQVEHIAKLVEKGASPYYRNIRSFESRIKTRLKRVYDHPHFWNHISKDKVALVCISCGDTYDIAGKPALLQKLKQENIPYIIISQFHEENAPLDDYRRSVIADVFHSARKLVFVSRRNKENAERNLVSRFSNAVVIPNPIKTHFTKIAFPDTDVIQFACVARLESKYKNQDILIEAFSDERILCKKWKLNIYGTGPDESYLKQLVHFFGLSERVSFCGYLNDIEEIWKNNHCLLLPSLGEGTPLALLEAMASGRGAMVTNVGGNAEWVIQGVNGIVIDGFYKELLSEQILGLLSNPAQMIEFGEKSFSIIEEKFRVKPEIQLLDIIEASI